MAVQMQCWKKVFDKRVDGGFIVYFFDESSKKSYDICLDRENAALYDLGEMYTFDIHGDELEEQGMVAG